MITYPELTDPFILSDPERLAIYRASRERGNTHRFAEMCAYRQPPGTAQTDRAFMQGRGHVDQFEGGPASEYIGECYRQMAAEAGVSTQGKYYSSALARFPGDPRAWISGIDDAKRIAEEDDLHVEGVFHRTATWESEQADRSAEELSRYRVDDKLVDQYVKERLVDNPELAADTQAHPEKLEDLRESVRAELTPGYEEAAS